MELQDHIEQVEHICQWIENEEEYLGKLKEYLPAMNQSINDILSWAQNPEIPFDINIQFVLQVLRDIVYGVEHGDSVFLLDTLRYGLLVIYEYTAQELKGEE